MNIKISLCASAIRTSHWLNFYHSLLSNNISFEVIFVGNVRPDFALPNDFRYIYSNTKPAQCYDIAFRNATGELIHWTADDATYSEGALDKIYDFYKSFNNDKLIVALRTVEDGVDITEGHRFIYKANNTPRMAPFGVMNRELFIKLGSYDKRFICGQSENDIVMRIYEIGGRLEICNNVSVFVHHVKIHSSGTLIRGNNYMEDRKVLESLWVKDGTIQNKRLDSVKSYEDRNILSETQGQKGVW